MIINGEAPGVDEIADARNYRALVGAVQRAQQLLGDLTTGQAGTKESVGEALDKVGGAGEDTLAHETALPDGFSLAKSLDEACSRVTKRILLGEAFHSNRQFEIANQSNVLALRQVMHSAASGVDMGNAGYPLGVNTLTGQGTTPQGLDANSHLSITDLDRVGTGHLLRDGPEEEQQEAQAPSLVTGEGAFDYSAVAATTTAAELAARLSTLDTASHLAPPSGPKVGLGMGKSITHIEAFAAGLGALLDADPSDTSDAIKYARRLNTKLTQHLDVVHDTEVKLEDFWRKYTGQRADAALTIKQQQHLAPPGGHGGGPGGMAGSQTSTSMMFSGPSLALGREDPHHMRELVESNRFRAPADFDPISTPLPLVTRADVGVGQSGSSRPVTAPLMAASLKPVVPPTGRVENNNNNNDDGRQAKMITLPSSAGQRGNTADGDQRRERGNTVVHASHRSISAVVNKGMGARAVAGKTIDFRKIDNNNPTQKRLEDKLRRRMKGQ